MTPRRLHRIPVSTLLTLFINAGGDPSVFCYRMGVDILSAGREHFRARMPRTTKLAAVILAARRSRRLLAAWQSQGIGTQIACSNLSSTFSAHFLTLKD
jgi:hypothetical protein